MSVSIRDTRQKHGQRSLKRHFLGAGYLITTLVLGPAQATEEMKADDATVAVFGHISAMAAQCDMAQAPIDAALNRYFDTTKTEPSERERLRNVKDNAKIDYGAKYPKQDCSRVKQWYEGLISEKKTTGDLGRFYTETPGYDPQLGWQTRQGAILCQSYFAMKDAEAAANINDRKWFDQTGCLSVRAGLRLVIVDAPQPREIVDRVWRARVYLPNTGAASFDVYLRPSSAVNFADGGTFKSKAEAQKALALMRQRDKRSFNRDSTIDARIIETADSSNVRLLIGPASYLALDLFCDSAREHRETHDEWMKRKQADSEHFNRTLEIRESKAATGPKLACGVPPLSPRASN
jgi:hypothetical protein